MCRKRSFATHAAPSRWTCSATPCGAAGVDDAVNLYHDLASGVRDDRPGLDSCLWALRKGDVLVVWKLDRLGRNLAHLVNTVQDLSAPREEVRAIEGPSAAGRGRQLWRRRARSLPPAAAPLGLGADIAGSIRIPSDGRARAAGTGGHGPDGTR